MNDSQKEYPGGRNGNGNGHGKIFDLSPKEDATLAKVAPNARKECCRDTSLTEGARMFFCYLTDCALTFGTYIRRGVVKFADSDLARQFDVSPKTIRNWKRALQARGRIWLTERWNKNSFPTTVYNITALVGQPELPLDVESRDGSIVADENFSASNRHPGRFLRRDPASGNWACRMHGVSGCSICRSNRRGGGFQDRPQNQPKTDKKATDKGPCEKILPSTTAIDYRAPRKQITAHHGKNLPTPTAKFYRGGGKPFTVAHGKNLPLPTVTDCRGQRKEVADNGKTVDGDLSISGDRGKSSPPDLALNEWIKDLKSRKPRLYPRELQDIKTKLLEQRLKAEGVQARLFINKKIDAVDELMLGPTPPSETPKASPVRVAPKPVMPFAEQKRHWETAKKSFAHET
jgi:hypothetical protein